MPEAEREKIEREVLGDLYVADCPIRYVSEDSLQENDFPTADVWLLPVIEVNRVRKMRETIASEQTDYYNLKGPCLSTEDLSYVLHN